MNYRNNESHKGTRCQKKKNLDIIVECPSVSAIVIYTAHQESLLQTVSSSVQIGDVYDRMTHDVFQFTGYYYSF